MLRQIYYREMGHFNLFVTYTGFVSRLRHELTNEAESFTLAYSRGLKRIQNKWHPAQWDRGFSSLMHSDLPRTPVLLVMVHSFIAVFFCGQNPLLGVCL